MFSIKQNQNIPGKECALCAPSPEGEAAMCGVKRVRAPDAGTAVQSVPLHVSVSTYHLICKWVP